MNLERKTMISIHDTPALEAQYRGCGVYLAALENGAPAKISFINNPDFDAVRRPAPVAGKGSRAINAANMRAFREAKTAYLEQWSAAVRTEAEALAAGGRTVTVVYGSCGEIMSHGPDTLWHVRDALKNVKFWSDWPEYA